MRTTMDIDEILLRKAMGLARLKTKRETVERGLNELIRAAHIERLLARRGKGDVRLTLRELSRMRRDE